MSSLQDRIESAIDRITSGHALMRVPVDETDPDTVLRDCQTRIAELEAERDKLRALLARYRNETPLGHQPHMIAHEVDAALQEGK